MFQKFLCIIKMLIALLLAYGGLTEFYFIISKGFHHTRFPEIIGYGIAIAMLGILAYYLVQTAVWNWKKELYKGNALLIIGLCLQLCFAFFIQFGNSFGKGGGMIVQACISLVLFGIVVFDAIKFTYSIRRKSKSDEELLSELLEDSK